MTKGQLLLGAVFLPIAGVIGGALGEAINELDEILEFDSTFNDD